MINWFDIEIITALIYQKIIITIIILGLWLEDTMLQLAGWSGYPFSSTKCALHYAGLDKSFQCFGAVWIFCAFELDSESAWS